MAVGFGASSASAATPTNMSTAVSNNQQGATGVTYTQQLTTATTGTIGAVRIRLPVTAPNLGLGTVYGLGAGTVSLFGGGESTDLLYTVSSPQNVAAGTPIYIEYTGLTNTHNPKFFNPSGWVAQMTTFTGQLQTSPVLDQGSSFNFINFGATNTAAVVQVAKSLTFTNDTPAYTLLMDPSLPALSDLSKTVNLGVKTNAGQGYSISMKDTGLKTAGTGAAEYTIPAASNSTVSAFAATANQFGVTATSTTANSLAVLASTYSGANISGYSTAGATIIAATKSTGNTADTIALANRVKIDYTTPAGTYTDTITYTATPAY
jgi:uncharacterized protein YerC